MWKLFNFYPFPEESGGGSGSEDPPAAKPPEGGTGESVDTPGKVDMIEYAKYKMAIDENKKYRDREAKAKKDAEQAKLKALEAQGEYKTVNEQLKAENERLKTEHSKATELLNKIEEQRKAKLETLMKDLPEEDKKLVEAGANTAAKILLAERFGKKPKGTPDIPRPGGRQGDKTQIEYPSMKT